MVPGRRDARRSSREYQKDVIAGTLEGLHWGFPLGFPPLASGGINERLSGGSGARMV